MVDKTAIVANICGYDFRVNASKLEETQNSLASCIMALLIANGDFSLLVPQFYRVPEAESLGTWQTPRDISLDIRLISHRIPIAPISVGSLIG